MARRPERNFFEQIRRNLPKAAPRVDLGRVENVANTGWPDVNYCIDGVEGNAELKAWERIRLTGRFTVPKLRPEQSAWLARRAGLGGRAYLLCRINKDVALFDGRVVPALFDKELHADWQDGAKIATLWLEHPVDWAKLGQALIAVPVSSEEIASRLALFRKRKIELDAEVCDLQT